MQKVLAGHAPHAPWPGKAAYVHPVQSRHAVLDMLPVLGLWVPAGHERQAALDVPPVLGLYEPGAQLEHDDAPAVL